ncbi:MAG: hypothetical protein AB2417_15135 [Clostridiaceae bacterium]
MCKSEVIIIDTVSNSLMVIEGMSRSLEQVPPALQFLRLVMDSINNSANIDMEMSNRRIIDVEIIEETSAELEELTRAQDAAANSSNGLSSKIKGLISDFLKFENIKKGLDATIGGAARLEKEIINMGNALGNKDVGKALFLNLNKYANESAYSIEELNGITREFINSTKDPNKLMNLNKTAEKLTLLAPGQGLTGAGGAVKEALGGDYASLQSNFQFNDGDIQMLQSAEGMDDFINKFNILLDKKGATEQALQELNMSASSQFSNISSNIQTAFAQAGGNALEALKPILTTINEGFRDERFQPFFDGIANGISTIANIGVWLFNIMQSIGSSIQDNWGTIAPILAGAIGAMITLKGATLAYNIVQGISKGIQLASAIATAIYTKSALTKTNADISAAAAQWGLNAAIFACPLTWMVIAIIAVITAIVAWSAHTNGMKATWLMFTNILLSAWDAIKISAFITVYAIMDMWDSLIISCYKLSVNIQNALGDMKAGGLMILQNFVNGAIGYINDLINKVNKIPGVSIEAIDKVTFGTEAIVENDLEKSARNKALDDYIAKKDESKKIRHDKMNDIFDKVDADLAVRQANIEKAKQEHAKGSESFNLDNNMLEGLGTGLDKFGAAPEMGAKDGLALANNNLGQIKDSIDVSNENLELMRDLAEQESIQNFVTLTPTVQVTTGDIKEEADINKIISKIETYMQIELVNSAEGVYA